MRIKKKTFADGVHKAFKSRSTLDFVCQIWSLSDFFFFLKKILLLIPSFYLRHFENKESEPLRSCQSVKRGIRIWLKIDSARGTESGKQQSPKADHCCSCSIFLSCFAKCLDILPGLCYSQRIWARRADSGPGIIKLTWYSGPEFCQNSACRLTFREFARKKRKTHLYASCRRCIRVRPYRVLNICSCTCFLLLFHSALAYPSSVLR